MDEKKMELMHIASNILVAYYSAKNCFCTLSNKDPDMDEQEAIMREVLATFKKIKTQYINTIEEIARSME